MPYLAKGLEENAQVLVLCDLVWQVHDVQARQGFLLQPRLLSRLSSNRNPSALQDQRRPDTTCSSISFARPDPSCSPAAPVLLGLGKHHDNRGTAQPLAVDAQGRPSPPGTHVGHVRWFCATAEDRRQCACLAPEEARRSKDVQSRDEALRFYLSREHWGACSRWWAGRATATIPATVSNPSANKHHPTKRTSSQTVTSNVPAVVVTTVSVPASRR